MNKLYNLILSIALLTLLFVSCSNSDIEKKVKNRAVYFARYFGQELNIDMSQFPGALLDIQYAEGNNPRQTLDIIYPFTGKPPFKTIVVIHGGGWESGNKQYFILAPIFQAATQGYAVVSINYRLSPEVKWPVPLHDAKSAVRFIRANGVKYKLDTKKLVVWGGSAGGHIAEMLAATNDRPGFEDLTSGNSKFSSAVQGVVAWCAVSDMSTLTGSGISPANAIMGFDVRKNRSGTRDANPIDLVSDKFPPILLVHGTKDTVVPYQQSKDMQERVNMLTKSSRAELITFEGDTHDGETITLKENVSNNLYFVDKILFRGKNPYRNKNYIEIKLQDR